MVKSLKMFCVFTHVCVCVFFFQDDVTYTTVVPTDTAQRPKVVSPEERTEYAVIKLNQ